MKQLIMLGATLLSLSTATVTQAENTAESLTLTITGLKAGKGYLMGTFYKTPEDFKAEANGISRIRIPITAETMEVTLVDLPNTPLIFTGYQDLNGDEKLNTNLVGAPKEPYGFSNNARGRFGPPKFDKAEFNPAAVADMTVEFR